MPRDTDLILADNAGVLLAEKPTAHIENWMRIPTMYGHAYLMGTVSDHPRQSEFRAKEQITSQLVSFDEEAGVAETRNTRYTLGKKFSA
jgi:hypothetical protein